MKIVILDGYTENPGDLSWDGFAALGELTVYDRTPADQILSRIGDAEIVITNKTPLTRETFAACPGMRYVGVLATGYNVVDIEAAIEKGIWNTPLIELAGKTMGIIGFGRIGQNTAQIARAFGLRVLAYDEYPNDAARALGDYVTLDELLAQSDIVSLHCPLFPSTEGIINKDSIAKMKDGVILINTSRGPLVEQADLAQALNSGKVYAAGLDVVATEPIRADNPLLSAKNCIITPHIAWAPKESRARLMEIAVNNLKAFLEQKPVNVVNA